ncbi:armadillo-type protein [Dichomitus squalens]|uniref:Armadillo-type protein n=1 Tax=Dichomitus squalens TaxID=114155 RepID=A0A4Q9N035_9APHY|nr:armadillo-type protein [Dichomitus squalens]
MFKSILPSRRIPSSDFQMLTSPIDSTESDATGKENYFANAYDTNTTNNAKPKADKRKKMKGKAQPESEAPQDFDKLLDELQIPSTLRPKLATMDPTVKAAFLKSSHVLAQMKPAPTPFTPRTLRRAQSSESVLSSPRPQKPTLEEYDLTESPIAPMALGTGHSRGKSLDIRRQALDPRPAPVAPLKVSKDKKKSVATTPEKYVKILLAESSTSMDIEVVKKLRLLLRNESASWTEAFLQHGGYDAILTRLNEILDVEWREEQHDDQMLFELLRCVKALSTSAVGCAALRAQCPAPFDKLVRLLYSDKKPGDVPTRQLIVELLLNLFDLYPPSSLPSTGSPGAGLAHSRSRSIPWELSATAMSSTSNLVVLPRPHSTLFSFIKALLLTPAPPPSEAPATPIQPHEFIEELHRPRVYKTYLQELSDLCRDYFWVFCHPSNAIWELSETDEAKVEKPRAPGGMTGGVEFEAMCYMTMHFKFVNAIASHVRALNLPKEHEHSAYRFHQDMFLSGIERILSIARKASTTYYPTLHLEIARYVAFAGLSGIDVPWSLSRMIGQPPTAMRKQPVIPPAPVIPPRTPPSRSMPTTPTKRGAPPAGFAGYAAPQQLVYPSGHGGAPSRTSVDRERERAQPQSRKVTPMFN